MISKNIYFEEEEGKMKRWLCLVLCLCVLAGSGFAAFAERSPDTQITCLLLKDEESNLSLDKWLTLSRRGEAPLSALEEYYIALLAEEPQSTLDDLFADLDPDDRIFVSEHFEREFERLESLSGSLGDELQAIKEYYYSTVYPQMKVFLRCLLYWGYVDEQNAYFENFDKNAQSYLDMKRYEEMIRTLFDPNFYDEELRETENHYERYAFFHLGFEEKHDVGSYNDMKYRFLQLPKKFQKAHPLPPIAPWLENYDPYTKVEQQESEDIPSEKLLRDIENAELIEYIGRREHPVKEWTLRFNQKVGQSPEAVIRLVNLSKNRLVPAEIIYTNDEKIRIFPNQAYIAGDEYVLFISGILSKEGHRLRRDVRMPFIFQFEF